MPLISSHHKFKESSGSSQKFLRCLRVQLDSTMSMMCGSHALHMLAYACACGPFASCCSPKGLIAFSNTGTDPCQTLIFRHSLTRWAKGPRHRRNRRKRRYETWRFDCMMQVPESSWWWLDPNSQMFLGEFDPWCDHVAPFYTILTMMDSDGSWSWRPVVPQGPWCKLVCGTGHLQWPIWGAYAGVSWDVAPFSWSSPGCHFVSCRAGAMFILEAAALSFAHPAGDWCLNCGSRQEIEKRKSTIKNARFFQFLRLMLCVQLPWRQMFLFSRKLLSCLPCYKQKCPSDPK